MYNIRSIRMHSIRIIRMYNIRSIRMHSIRIIRMYGSREGLDFQVLTQYNEESR